MYAAWRRRVYLEGGVNWGVFIEGLKKRGKEVEDLWQ